MANDNITPYPDPNENPPMQVPGQAAPAPMDGTEDLENVMHPSGTQQLESHDRAARVNAMAYPEEQPPQAPPPPGKEQFHNTMADFSHRAEANRAEMIGLDPSDPQYTQKLAALQAQHGALTTEKARYQMLHPWGGPESAHPGVLGKIGHVAGEIGNAVGNAELGPGVMSGIPGTEANLQAQAAGGMAEGKGAAGEAAQAASAGEKQAKGELEGAKAEEVGAPVAPKNPQGVLAGIEAEDTAKGVKFTDDPRVQQAEDAITGTQPERNQPRPNDFEQYYSDYLKDNNLPDSARNREMARSQWAKVSQAPQRPPQTLVVEPGGKVETARPGSTLPEGTQNVGGFANMGRPTTQMRNVDAQAQMAAQGIPGVVAEIDQLKDQLGPVSGRWNEFMQGRVGMENPQMAGLRADLLMVASAVALAHARGRLPENLREEFDKMINAPKQDPENLKAVLNHILPWMQRMGTMGQERQGGNENPPAPQKKWNAIKGVYE